MRKAIYKFFIKCVFFLSNQLTALVHKKEQIDLNNDLKVCAFHTLNIGDTIMLSPAIVNLSHVFGKNLYIVCTFLGYKVLRGIIPDEQFIIYNPDNFLEYIKIIRKVSKHNFDIIFDFHNSFFGFQIYLFPILVSCPKTLRIGYKTDFYKGFLLHYEQFWVSGKKHESEHYADLLESINIEIPSKDLYVYCKEEITEMVEEKLEDILKDKVDKKIFLIHPCCSNMNRLWDSEKFADVAEWLVNKYNCYLFFTGLKQEKYIIYDILRYMKERKNVFDVSGLFDFYEFVALIKRADLLVAIDTSAVHIASATKTNTVAIYGPTHNIVWAPYNKENQVLVYTELTCYPCEEKFSPTVCKDLTCLRSISAQRVKDAIETLF